MCSSAWRSPWSRRPRCINGATPAAVATSFGDGFWSLITFTMQMAMVVISGYVVATSPPAAKLIDALAGVAAQRAAAPSPFVAAVSMLTSLLNWGMSLVFCGLLVRALARRTDLQHGLSRRRRRRPISGSAPPGRSGSARRPRSCRPTPASLPKPLLADHRRHPVLADDLPVAIDGDRRGSDRGLDRDRAVVGALGRSKAVTAQMMDDERRGAASRRLRKPERPGEWLEYSPLLTLIVVALGGGWLAHEFATKDPILAISNLNTYNLMFLMLGALLHWRPRNFLNAVAKAVPATTGVLIQFPLYGGIATIMTTAKGAGGHTVADQVAHAFVSLTTHRHVPGRDGHLLGGARLLHPVGRRQVDHRGALCDAGGQ